MLGLSCRLLQQRLLAPARCRLPGCRPSWVSRAPGCKQPLRGRRLLSGFSGEGAARSSPLLTAAVTLGGVGAFVAFDQGTGFVLRHVGVAFPSSVACIIVGGTVSLHPRVGPALQRIFGPGASWLRAGLPVFLCPPVLAPIVMDNPGAEYVGKMVVVAFAGLFSTMALVGHLATRLMPTGSAGLSIVYEPPMVAATAAAARALTSGRVAIGLAVAGCLGSAILLWATGRNHAHGEESVPMLSEAWIKAPGYTGLALAAYIAGSWLPPGLKLICPPTFFAAGTAIALTLAVDGRKEVASWLDGAGVTLLSAVSPAIATFGLYAHNYKALLMKHAVPLGLVCILTAPPCLLGVAHLGAMLGLDPPDVAGLVPATTTTGLAFAMGESMPLATQALIPLGPMVCGLSAVVLFPAFLRATAMHKKASFHRGFSLGSVAHVSVMAALLGAGQQEAAEAAALALFLLGT